MRRIIVSAMLLIVAARVSAADVEWHVLKGKHFLVYHQHDADFAGDVLRRAEAEYNRIAHRLGITRYGNFWLWGDRAQIYLYPDKASYVRLTGAPAWTAGKADYAARRITVFKGLNALLDSVLPHELTHLIFREFVGFTSDVPLWLDEGVAQWMDRANQGRMLELARLLHRRNRLMPLDLLMATDVRQTASTLSAVEFYAQSVSLVAFMIETYGAARFRRFCGHLRDGKSIDDALRFTYASSIRNMKQLETVWLESLKETTHED